jgi:hypothetical protein
MMDETFETFVARERARLHGEREAIFAQQQELENKLAGINRELDAIDAYEATKAGKAVAVTRQRATRKQGQTRRGRKREQLLEVIRQNPGLARKDILERMGLRGSKSGEMSISNGLTGLIKVRSLVKTGGIGRHRGVDPDRRWKFAPQPSVERRAALGIRVEFLVARCGVVPPATPLFQEERHVMRDAEITDGSHPVGIAGPALVVCVLAATDDPTDPREVEPRHHRRQQRLDAEEP